MKKNKIKEIAKGQINNLQNKFNKIVPNFDPEDIHKFRLEYKKMRAFFRMIQQKKSKALKSNFPESLKNIYKITGKIRDLQLIELNINRLIKGESKELVGYFSLMKNKISKLKIELFKTYLKKPISKSDILENISFPNKFGFNDCKTYFEILNDNISKILGQNNLKDSSIHSIRKSYKDLFFNVKMLENEYGITIESRDNVDNWYHNFLEQLGEFQDLCTSIEYLSNNSISKLIFPERKILESIKQKWALQKKNSKKLILQKLG